MKPRWSKEFWVLGPCITALELWVSLRLVVIADCAMCLRLLGLLLLSFLLSAPTAMGQVFESPPALLAPRGSFFGQPSRKSLREQYSSTLKLRRTGQLTEAEALLQTLMVSYRDMQPRILVDLCLTASRRKQWNRARAWAEEALRLEGASLEGGNPGHGSVADWAHVCRGEALFAQSDFDGAIGAFKQAKVCVSKGGPSPSRVLLRLGNAYRQKNDWELAYRAWLQAKVQGGDGEFARAALPLIELAKGQLGVGEEIIRVELRLAMLEKALEDGKKSWVIDQSMALIPTLKTASLRAELMVLESRARAAMDSEADAIRRLLPLTYRANLRPQTYAHLVNDLQKLYGKTRQIESRLKILRRYIATFSGQKRALWAQEQLAHILERAGRDEEADIVRLALIKAAPASTQADEARWLRARRHILEEDFEAALPILESLLSTLPVQNAAHERALYWLGRSAQSSGRPMLGWWLLEEVVRLYPDSYYGTLALGLFEPSRTPILFAEAGQLVSGPYFHAQASPSADGYLFDPSVSTWSPARRLLFEQFETLRSEVKSPSVARAMGRAVDLLLVGQRHLGLVELADLRTNPEAKGPALLVVSAAYHSLGQLQRGMRVGHMHLAKHGELSAFENRELRWQMAYPFPFFDHFYREGWRHGLQPALLVAMAQQESGFWPTAHSGAGARGLMQVLPRTARSMAAKHKMPRPSQPTLYQPSVNVRLGAAYIREMLDTFDGSLVRALAAYNAGPGAVNRWDKGLNSVADDIFAEAISYDETNDYVRVVLRNVAGYLHTYPALQLSADSQPVVRSLPTSPEMRVAAQEAKKRPAKVPQTPKAKAIPEVQAQGLVGPGGTLRWD